jgi:amino acid adenylation domain-containing protein
VVAARAAETPDAVAVRQGDRTLTYAQLVTGAAGVADRLRARGVRRDTFVPTIMDRSVDLVTVLLGILSAGAAYVPVDRHWPLARREHVIARSSGPVTVVDDVEPPYGTAGYASAVELLGGGPTGSASNGWAAGTGTDPACVFFTSGSTGWPKGVVAPHRGIVRAVVDSPALPFGPHTTQLVAAPIAWDGFAFELWAALLNGGCAVLREGETGPVDGHALRRAVRDGVNTLLLPSPLFTVLAEERPDLFGELALLVVAGDRMSVAASRRVLHRFPGLHLVNAYGPAENSIITTAHVVRPADLDESATDVPIGRPVPRARVAVVDETGAPVPPGSVGELLVSGDGVAIGYLGEPEETARSFTAGERGPLPPGRWYRTGDLVALDGEGNLRYRGRRDRQVKINGVRIEPGEIEAVLEAIPAIAACAVTLHAPGPGRTELACVYTTPDGTPLPERAIRTAAADRLLDVMIPTIFCHCAELPVGATGKIDHTALVPLVEAHLARVSTARRPVDGSSRPVLLDEIAALLGRTGIGAGDNLLDNGMTSLDALRVAARIGDALGVGVGVADVYRWRSVEAISRQVTRRPAAAHGAVPVTPADTTDAPLASAQRRFLFAERLSPGAADNLTVQMYLLRGPLRTDDLRRALRDVVDRHPVLRTVYPVVHGEPVQRVLNPADAMPTLEEVPVPGMADRPVEEAAQDLATDGWNRTPFRLDREVPLRVTLYRLGAERHLLRLLIHHIAIDGWSERVLVSDLAASYRYGGALRQPPTGALTYPDYGRWERGQLDAWAGADLGHWNQVLAEAPSPFLPPPTSAREAEVAELVRTVDGPTVARLVRAAARSGGPPLAGVVAAAGMALGRAFGVSGVCLGTVVSTRFDTAWEPVLGCFINPVPLVLHTVFGPAADVLRGSATEVLSALEHARTPFDELVRVIGPARGRHPWFQAFVVLQDEPVEARLDRHTTLVPVRVRQPRTSREWLLQVFPRPDGGWDLVAHWRRDGLSPVQATSVLDGLVAAIGELVGDA